MITALLGYVGPGPGLTMVWAFVALLGTIALALLSVLLWPIRMLMKKVRGTSPTAQQNTDLVTLDGAEPTAPAEMDDTQSH